MKITRQIGKFQIFGTVLLLGFLLHL